MTWASGDFGLCGIGISKYVQVALFKWKQWLVSKFCDRGPNFPRLWMEGWMNLIHIGGWEYGMMRSPIHRRLPRLGFWRGQRHGHRHRPLSTAQNSGPTAQAPRKIAPKTEQNQSENGPKWYTRSCDDAKIWRSYRRARSADLPTQQTNHVAFNFIFLLRSFGCRGYSIWGEFAVCRAGSR